MTSHLISCYYITRRNIFVIDLTSTMVKYLQLLPNPDQRIKFPKSNSLSSLKTQHDVVYEKDLITRKISEDQKQKLISLITSDNYTMKDAAKYVNISYSTAKKVFSKFRQDIRENLREKGHQYNYKVRATYVQVEPEDPMTESPVTVFSLVAGVKQTHSNEPELMLHSDT